MFLNSQIEWDPLIPEPLATPHRHRWRSGTSGPWWDRMVNPETGTNTRSGYAHTEYEADPGINLQSGIKNLQLQILGVFSINTAL